MTMWTGTSNPLRFITRIYVLRYGSIEGFFFTDNALSEFAGYIIQDVDLGQNAARAAVLNNNQSIACLQ